LSGDEGTDETKDEKETESGENRTEEAESDEGGEQTDTGEKTDMDAPSETEDTTGGTPFGSATAREKRPSDSSEKGRLGSALSTLGSYLADHTVHLVVIALLGLYPGVYFVVTNVFPPAEFLLPSVNSMVAVFYFGLFAMSFDFISGYTGYLSLGHAAFYGIGAYAVLMVANGLVPFISPDTWFMITIVVAGLISVFFAVIIGLVSFRLRGFYFAMITLGFTQVMYVFMSRWRYPVGGEGSNPEFGISANPEVTAFELGIPYVDVVSLDFSGNMLAIGRLQGDSVSSLFGTGIGLEPPTVSYYMIGIVVLICYFMMQRIIHSPFGSVLIAIRENEERARAIGYNVFAYKIAAFSISAFFAAVAGGLFAGYERAVEPDQTFFFMRSADAILATVIGGFGTLAGPLYGRGLQAVFENFLGAPFVPDFLAGRDILFLGILFILFVLYLPTGIVGAVRSRAGGKLSDVFGEKISNYFSNF
jgi:branched-chain amino acid transport system permease protein